MKCELEIISVMPIFVMDLTFFAPLYMSDFWKVHRSRFLLRSIEARLRWCHFERYLTIFGAFFVAQTTNNFRCFWLLSFVWVRNQLINFCLYTRVWLKEEILITDRTTCRYCTFWCLSYFYKLNLPDQNSYYFFIFGFIMIMY